VLPIGMTRVELPRVNISRKPSLCKGGTRKEMAKINDLGMRFRNGERSGDQLSTTANQWRVVTQLSEKRERATVHRTPLVHESPTVSGQLVHPALRKRRIV